MFFFFIDSESYNNIFFLVYLVERKILILDFLLIKYLNVVGNLICYFIFKGGRGFGNELDFCFSD